MILKYHLYLLLFTFISSLASGQWESDQFLFSKKVKSTRPKQIRPKSIERSPQAKVDNKKNEPAVQPNEISSEEPYIENTRPHLIPVRAPAQVREKKLKRLQIEVGAIDLDFKTKTTDLNLNKHTLFFGAKVGIPVQLDNFFEFYYKSSQEIVVTSTQKIRWEDYGAHYLFYYQNDVHDFYLDTFLRQNIIWQSTSLNTVSLQPMNLVGLGAVFTGKAQGQWTPEYKLNYAPFVKNNDNSLSGYALSFEWETQYQLKMDRKFLVHINYEWMNLKGNHSNSNVEQKNLIFNIGYLILSR